MINSLSSSIYLKYSTAVSISILLVFFRWQRIAKLCYHTYCHFHCLCPVDHCCTTVCMLEKEKSNTTLVQEPSELSHRVRVIKHHVYSTWLKFAVLHLSEKDWKINYCFIIIIIDLLIGLLLFS